MKAGGDNKGEGKNKKENNNINNRRSENYMAGDK
jgi:hypothetical protein